MAPALLFMFALLYLLPTVVALLRGIKTPQGPILLNILLGWTGLGWIGALIWAACAPVAAPVDRLRTAGRPWCDVSVGPRRCSRPQHLPDWRQVLAPSRCNGNAKTVKPHAKLSAIASGRSAWRISYLPPAILNTDIPEESLSISMSSKCLRKSFA
jgi:hypothetical protein